MVVRMNRLGFRANPILALDGGGYRIVMVTRALALLEADLGAPLRDVFAVVAGTSAGALVAAAIACGMPAAQIHELVVENGPRIFKPRVGWPLVRRWRYDTTALERALLAQVGEVRLGEIRETRLVITALDATTGRTLFIKSRKAEYDQWRVVDAVRASSAVPTLFAPLGDLVDGGIGGWNNAALLGAVQGQLEGYVPETVTLVSLGTGASATGVRAGRAGRMWPGQWVLPLLRLLLAGPSAQQLYLVQTLYPGLDLRRYQPEIAVVALDDTGANDYLVRCGDEIWKAMQADGARCEMERPA